MDPTSSPRIYSILFVTFLILAVFCGWLLYQHFGLPFRSKNLIFSDKVVLEVLWQNYKKDYLDPGTLRALDRQRGDITTSEGQSYTLLRAVWMDDKETFDKVFSWTVANLQHKKDHLFSWLYGNIGNGRYGVIVSQGGQNSATDADTDIALSLIFAYGRWGDKGYLDAARAIIADIWQNEVVVIHNVPYVVADNVEKNSPDRAVINPSYFAPYAYRIFSKVDTSHDWLAVVASSYDVLERGSRLPLDRDRSAGLPPDWVVINKRANALEPPSASGNATTDFGYDALRVVWRVSLDYMWFGDPRAKRYLDSLHFFSNEWTLKKSIASVYAHDGSRNDASETPAMYGGVVGYFKVADNVLGREVYSDKLKTLFDQDANSFRKPLGYYDSNWVWFGMGLYNDLLHNISPF